MQRKETTMPLVACQQCKAQVSDTALTCPQCGHPQPQQDVNKGRPGGRCSACGTLNLFDFAVDVDRTCRYCARPLREVNEHECILHQCQWVALNARETGIMCG